MTTTAADIRKSLKTEEIKINPKMELTESVGSFVLGTIRNRRDVAYEGRTFKVYELEVAEGSFDAFEGKGDSKKTYKWKKGDRLDLKGTAMINWALSNVQDGEQVLIEYQGTKKSAKKGQNDAHNFLVERVPARG